MPSPIQEELEAGVADVFCELGDKPNMVIRFFEKGTDPDSAIGGHQNRLPIGEPVQLVGILAERQGSGQEGISDLFVLPEALAQANEKGLTSPDYDSTVEEIGSGLQYDVRAPRPGGRAWKPYGPTPQDPVMWKARVVEGGDARAVT